MNKPKVIILLTAGTNCDEETAYAWEQAGATARRVHVGELIEQLRVTMDEGKQVELYHKIHRIIYEDQPYTFLFADKATGGYDSRIDNIKFYKIRPCVDGREWYSSRPRMLGP